jgi:putative transcriptional regulator
MLVDRPLRLHVRLQRWLRLASVAAAVLFAATTLKAALPTPDQLPRERDALAGQFLIAAPWMGDPRFVQAVVLMLRHDSNGALGLVINHPLGEQPLARLLGMLGDTDAGDAAKEKPTPSVLVVLGGPVQPDVAFVIHSGEYRRARTLDVDGRIAVTSGEDLKEVLHDMADNKGPQKGLLAFGYAGWGPGQLDLELANHVWTTTPEDPRLVFDEDRAKVWERAQEHRI